jgi:DNA topoisomerase VI subunit A/intein/homing endonuclease
MTTKKKPSTPSQASSKAVDALYTIAEQIYEELDGGQIPKMKIPLRTKANIRFDSKHSVWKYGSLMGVRSAKKLKGALMLLRTMHVLEFIRDMIAESKSSTLREMYYISEGWDIAKFHAQEESNLLAEDLEVITQLLREDFKLRPEESGASVIGNLTLEEITRNGERKRINCRDDVGDAGYTIPYNVEKEKVKLLEADAKFVLAIETGGMFDRLVENGFDDEAKCVLVHLKGQPSRSTRRLLKRLNEELKLPVATFSVSGDERIVVWENDRLKPVTIGPYVDELITRNGAAKRTSPFDHDRTSTEHLDIEVPAISGDGTAIARAKVTAAIRHPSPPEMYEIRCAYGLGIRTTGAHSVMVLENYTLIPKAVRTLQPGDLVVAALGLPRGDVVPELDVLNLLRNLPVWERLRTDLKRNGTRMRVAEALARGHTNFTVFANHGKIGIPRRLPLSRSLAKLLGYFAAEGSCGRRITLSFGSHEEPLIRDAIQCIRDCFPGLHIARSQPHPYSVQIEFGGGLVSGLFEALGTGRDAHSKMVPWPIFSMSHEDQTAFLRAYIQGDGHVRRRREGAFVQMTTVSRALASDLLSLLAGLGMNASVHRRRGSRSAVAPGRRDGSDYSLVYDVCLYGELTQLQQFRDLLDRNSAADATPRQRINSKFLAIPRELITEDLRRIIRRFNQGKGVGRFGDVYWGCKRITYPTLGRFLGNVPEGKSERLDFFRRLIAHRTALLPVRRVLTIPAPTPYVYDLEVPSTQTFLGGMGPICLHNTDGDPWSFRIHASVAYGAIKTAHISEYLATPTAEFVGITPSDILNYELPTDALTPRDIGALNAELSDPRFRDEFWRNEIQTMLQLNKKAEQQALAKYGLDYVTETYLPEKLGPLGLI